MTATTIPTIDQVIVRDEVGEIRFDNDASIRVYRSQGQVLIGYCWPGTIRTFVTEFAIGIEPAELTRRMAETWRDCETPADYDERFEVDVLTGRQPAIDGDG